MEVYEIIGTICVPLIPLAIHFIEKSYKQGIILRTQEKIRWCISPDRKYSYRMAYGIQRDLKIENNYLLLPSDEDYLHKIFEEFRTSFAEDYFNGYSVLNNKPLSRVSEEEFFLYYLNKFLRDMRYGNEGAGNFFGSVLFEKAEEIPSGDYMRKTYHLTDFGLAYYKLFYISEKYCITKQSKFKIDWFDISDSIKKEISSRVVTA